MTSEFSRADLDKPHLPLHRSFKARRFLIIGDLGQAWRDAQDAISRGDMAITAALVRYETLKKPDHSSEIHDATTEELAHSGTQSTSVPVSRGVPAQSDSPSSIAQLALSTPGQSLEPKPEKSMAYLDLNILESDELCYHCQGMLQSPCWYCVDCKGTPTSVSSDVNSPSDRSNSVDMYGL